VIKRPLIWRIARFLLIVVPALALVVAAVLYYVYSRADTSNVGELAFRNELRVPPLLESQTDSQGRRVFDLEIRPGTAELIPGDPAETWGYNGAYLGPTLRAARGEQVLMRVRNALPEATTTTHWHGMHLPGEADGGPHQEIEPGDTWTPSWRLTQPAATLWYHPHLHEATEEHVYRGLAGMFIIDDPRAAQLPLPREYGVDDIPVMIQDKRLDDGELDFSRGPISPIGRLGDTILVNGTYDPHLEVTRLRTRLRLVNASTARIYDIGFSDGRDFDLIATDQGFLPRTERIDRLPLAPGERAEIVVEMRPRESVVLRSFEPDLGADFFNERFAGGDDSFDLLQLRAADELAPSAEPPDSLAGRPAPERNDAAPNKRFELTSSSTIDGEELDVHRIDRSVPLGELEIWEVSNETGLPHTFHPHGTSFRVLDYAGGRPPAPVRGPKDNVLVPPDETVRLLVRFTSTADHDAPFMFHCHLIEHEDSGMMGQLVVEP
jgi:suppressor of ftsI